MKKNSKYIFCILILAVNYSFSQSLSCELHGTVVEAASTKKLSAASVTLKSKTEEEKKTVSSDSGTFQFDSLIPDREYQIEIRALNYTPYSSIIKLTQGRNEFVFSLADTTNKLKDVTVTSSAGKVTYEPGKSIFQISPEEIQNSANATVLLNKVPYINVSASGDVKIKGHIPAQIYIDGKAANSAVLQSLPIKNIDKIEVVSNSTGSIGSESTDGIINIVTKKNWDGYFGTVAMGAGTNENYTPSFSFNTKGKKLETNIFFSLIHYNNNFDAVTNWSTSASPVRYLQIDSGRNKGSIPYINLGLNYQIDSLSAISYLFWTTLLKYTSLRNSEYGSTNPEDEMLPDYLLNSTIISRYTTVSNSVDFTKKIRHSKNSYSLSAKYYGYLERDNTAQQQTDFNGGGLQTLQNNKAVLNEYSLQFSYALKSIKKISFSFGAKFISRQNKSNFLQSEFDSSSQAFVPDNNLNEGNNFSGTQNILGAFISASKKIKSLSLNASVRYEYTHDYENYYISVLRRDYGNFIPGITGTLVLNKESNINFSYAETIRRPGIIYLNPYINASNPTSLQQGNPYLLPEKRNRYEIEYAYSKNKFFLSVSPYFYDMNNQITQITSIYNQDTLISTYNNLGRNKTMGISISNNVSIIKNVTVNTSAGIEKNSLSNDSIRKTGSNFYINSSLSFLFSKKCSLNGSYQYSSSSVNIQGKNPATSSINVSINEKILSNLLLQLSASNFLSPNFHKTYIIHTNEISQTQKDNLHLTVYAVRLSYNFGQAKNKTYTNSKIINSDLKN